jgi:hypothetical protein
MPPFKGFVPKNKNKIFYQKGRKSEGKRGCAEGCGNVVNPLGFPYFHAPERGGKGEVTFSLSRLWRRSLAPLFPLSARRRSPPQRIFFFASFLEMSKTKFFPGLKEGCQAQKAAAWSSGARKEGTAENCTEKTLLSKN